MKKLANERRLIQRLVTRPVWLTIGALVLVLALTAGSGVAHATFPGVNGKIAFTSRTTNAANDLFQINQALPSPAFEPFPPGTVNTPQNDQNAQWSPDGLELAFASSRDGDFEIYVWNSVSGVTRKLTNNTVEDEGPGWSPDGTKIVFSSVVGKNKGKNERDVFTMNAATGSPQKNLTNHPAFDWGRAWSPDGNEILFASDRDGDYEIYGVSPNGGTPRRLTDNLVGDFGPDWSPDGSQIIFVREPGTRTETAFGDSQIWKMNALGDNEVLLFDNGVVDKQATWSPDGTKICWASTTSATGADYELWEANADGSGQPLQLTNDGANQFTPDYRPTP